MLRVKWESTVLHLPLMAIILICISLIPIVIQREWGMPLEKDSISWQVLESITKQPHPYNSNENLRIQKYLVETIKEIKRRYDTLNCSYPNPIALVEDNINLFYLDTFYESNNVIVKLEGSESQALLVSSHFDSTLTSHGVTDAGTGIASMISVLGKLSIDVCHAPLKHSVIFNFNNAEEYGLFGGAAFTKHPMFTQVKAFINLEGTGASDSEPACLFRTNSFPLVKHMLQNQRYPHASILFNTLIQFVRSDTDYRVYSTHGLPGVDVAFYSFRYLYHSPLDDLNHTSAKSVSHMVQNLYSGVIAIANHSDVLNSIRVDDGLETTNPFGVLPVPKFAFYDRFGVFGILQSQNTFITCHLILGICVLFVAACKGISTYFWNGRRSFWNHLLKPTLNSFLLVLSTILVSVIANVTFSALRTLVNPGLTYGNPEWTIATIFLINFISFCTMQLVWPRISKRLRLTSTKRFEGLYDAIPVSRTPLQDNLENSEDGSVYHETHDAQSSPRSPSGDDGIHDQSGVPEEQVPLVSDYDDERSSEDSQVDDMVFNPTSRKKDRTMTVWLPVGLCTFWLLMLFLSLVTSVSGMSVFYFLYDFALFSSISVLVTIIFDQIYKKLLHEDLQFEYTIHELRFIHLYENYFWVLQLLISTPVPAMFLMDVLKQVYLGLPSLVGEGVPDYGVDMVFSVLILLLTINFMPLLSRTNRKYSILVGTIIFACLWIPQFFVLPFSETRPYRYTYSETLDITNETSAMHTSLDIRTMPIGSPDRWAMYMQSRGVSIPEYSTNGNNLHFLFKYDDADLSMIKAWIQKETSRDATTIRGTVIGSPDSRYCHVSISRPAKQSWIDKQTNWVDYHAPLTNQTTLDIMKRSFNHNLNRIQFDFGFVVDDPATADITVQCRHGMEKSILYKEFRKQNRWMMDIGKYGFVVSKTFTI